MSYKFTKLVLLCLVGMFSFNVLALNNEKGSYCVDQEDVYDGLERIELHGTLMFGIGPNAINAGVGEDAVYIQFNQSFGYVAISLYNESGVLIYNDVVDTGVQQSVVIPINNVSSGSYLLELNNAAGYAEGFFDR